jgi:4-amino-4-deoxy-L-arabinose transferase-like glycosyltransferase
LKRWLVASAALLAIVFFVRSPTLLQSVESYVEALNLIVARELLSGHLPYTTAWESKPPLFFFILALFSLILGPTILTLRIASSLAIVAASLGILRIGLLFPRDSKWIGWTAGILYVAMTCSDSGLAGEAEVFYAPFVIWGVALALEALMERRDVTRVSALGVGLLAGIAFQIKISATLEAAFILVLIAYACRSDARRMLYAAAGFAVPIIAGFVPYYFTGQTSFYFDANFWVFARRAHAPPPSHDSILGALREQLEAFFPVCVLVLPLPLLLRRADPQERQLLAWLAAWAIAGLVTALAIRELLGYQFIPVMAPASVLGAWALVTLANVRLRGTIVVSVLAIGVIAHTVGGLVRAVDTVYHRVALADPTYGDETARLGEFLSHHRGQGKWLYVVNDQPALYILTGAPPPTRFPFPPHLLDPEQEIVSGIDGTREVARILDERPVFVVFDGSYDYADKRIGKENADRLRRNYALVYSVGGRGIYESLHPLSKPSSHALNPQD